MLAEWSSSVWLSSIMSADILITGCIMYGLIRSKTGWAHTDKVGHVVIRDLLAHGLTDDHKAHWDSPRVSISADHHRYCLHGGVW